MSYGPKLPIYRCPPSLHRLPSDHKLPCIPAWSFQSHRHSSMQPARRRKNQDSSQRTNPGRPGLWMAAKRCIYPGYPAAVGPLGFRLSMVEHTLVRLLAANALNVATLRACPSTWVFQFPRSSHINIPAPSITHHGFISPTCPTTSKSQWMTKSQLLGHLKGFFITPLRHTAFEASTASRERRAEMGNPNGWQSNAHHVSNICTNNTRTGKNNTCDG